MILNRGFQSGTRLSTLLLAALTWFKNTFLMNEFKFLIVYFLRLAILHYLSQNIRATNKKTRTFQQENWAFKSDREENFFQIDVDNTYIGFCVLW